MTSKVHLRWFGVVSLFPTMFEALSGHGVTGRAIRNGLVEMDLWDPREFTRDKHRTVDDRPYGGGPGMLMKVQPLVDALKAARTVAKVKGITPRVLYLSPQGVPLRQSRVEALAQEPGLILLAGRYEGVDERLIDREVDEEISLGDYVLSGGELPAMVLMDAIIRQVPGSLGHALSAQQDSFSESLLDCPHYTRPEDLDGMQVPQVLLSGHHEEVRRWRLQQALGRTWLRRPELLQQRGLSEEEQQLLQEFKHKWDPKGPVS